MRLRTLPFPVRRPTFAEVKRIHSKLATLYHPLMANDATKAKPRVEETHPAPCEAVTNDNLVADTIPLPDDGKTISVSKENVDYPDTRIRLQLDLPHKQPVDKNGTYTVFLPVHLLSFIY